MITANSQGVNVSIRRKEEWVSAAWKICGNVAIRIRTAHPARLSGSPSGVTTLGKPSDTAGRPSRLARPAATQAGSATSDGALHATTLSQGAQGCHTDQRRNEGATPSDGGDISRGLQPTDASMR